MLPFSRGRFLNAKKTSAEERFIHTLLCRVSVMSSPPQQGTFGSLYNCVCAWDCLLNASFSLDNHVIAQEMGRGIYRDFFIDGLMGNVHIAEYCIWKFQKNF